MRKLSFSRGQVVCFAVGTLIGVAVMTALGLVSQPKAAQVAATVQQTRPDEVIAQTQSALEPGTSAGRCYLGVVLACDSVDLAAEISGRIERIAVRVGDQVQRDQLIATLDTQALTHELARERAAELTAEAHRQKVELEAERAGQEYQRRLALEGLLSQEEKEAARYQQRSTVLAVEVATAELAQVRERVEQLELQLIRSELRAPFDGTVASRYLDAGALAAQGTPVVRLISDALLVRFAVPPEDAELLRPGTEVQVEIESLPAPTVGTVDQLAPEIDSASQLMFVEASINPPVHHEQVILSGSVVWVSIPDKGEPQRCLPRRARPPTTG